MLREHLLYTMPVSGDTRQALKLLERIQLHLKDSEAAQLSPSVGDDLNTLISVLDSPVFHSILNIQDSLQELKRQLHKHPSILPVDFDISPTTGELLLNVPADPIPLQNSDSYEPSSDPDQNYNYEGHVAKARAALKADEMEPQSNEMSSIIVAPPQYVLSAITTESYAEEFQRTIDQGAQGREIHTLQLFKPEGSSLGFSVVGLRSEQKGELGIFIQEIQPSGIAGRDGRLQEGDQILAIDGQPLDSNISHQQAISILQQARGLVELVVARGGITAPDHQGTTTATAAVSLERSPSAVSDTSKGSDMVLNTEWAQVESIDLLNDGSGLGFGIIGGRSTGVVVKTILPGGVADRDGRLQSGDHILQIGDVNLRGMGSEQVAMVLRQSGSHVRLIVARPVDPAACGALRSHAPLVPTRILADPEEVEKHLAMFAQNGFAEPSPYKGPASVDATFAYQRELASDYGVPGASSFTGPGMRSGAARGDPDLASELPEMETFEVELVKDQQGLGITIAGYVCEKEEISGIFVKSIAKGSAADMCGQIRVNDQIIEVDGRPLHGYTNHDAVEVLRSTGKSVKLRLARYLRGAKYQQLQLAIASGELSYPTLPTVQAQVHEPKMVAEAANKEVDVNDINLLIDNDYESLLSPRVEAAIQAKWSKIMGPEYEIVVAQLSKFREGGGLGISLEGTVDVEDGKEVRPHHYIRSILPDGPVGVNGKLQGGDELLEVNGEKLLGMNHHGVVATLKELPMHVRMVCARRLLPCERETHPSLSQANYSHPFHMEYDLSTVPDFMGRGMLSGPFGGSLTSLTPTSERLVKAKSDGSLAIGTSAASSPPMEAALSKLKSRSLEPLTGLAMWSSEPQIIELMKGDRGLGFSILDYQDPMNPNETVIVIRSLVPGGVAQQDGRLIPGDRLLFVNDINLENASLDAAVQALKGAPKGVVRIGVAKPLPLPESGQSGQMSLDSSPTLPDLKSSFELPLRLNLHLDLEQVSSSPDSMLMFSPPPPPEGF